MAQPVPNAQSPHPIPGAITCGNVQTGQRGADKWKGQCLTRDWSTTTVTHALLVSNDVVEDAISGAKSLAELERAKATLDAIADGVVCTDVGGDVTYLNAANRRMDAPFARYCASLTGRRENSASIPSNALSATTKRFSWLEMPS